MKYWLSHIIRRHCTRYSSCPQVAPSLAEDMTFRRGGEVSAVIMLGPGGMGT